MSDWQPIETAPRDGTRILAMWGDHPPRIIKWVEADGPYRFANWLPESGPIVVYTQPLCWMPLPEPPHE